MTKLTEKEIVWDSMSDIYFFLKGYLHQNTEERDFDERHLRHLTEMMGFYRDNKKND